MLKNVKAVLLFLIGTGWLAAASAQLRGLDSLQLQIQQTIKQVRPACVFLVDNDTVGKAKKGGRFSGVVVSRDGIILTAAHATVPGRQYTVDLPDGRHAEAMGLGCVPALDLAMIKICGGDDWPFAAMGHSSSLPVGTLCLSIAYPASFEPERLVVRFGEIAETSPGDISQQMRTTCLMEPGDSGGPVFDLQGNVIAMHSNILIPLEANFEAPIDNYRRFWHVLQTPAAYVQPKAEEIAVAPIAPQSMNADTLKRLKIEQEKRLNSAVLMISSEINGVSSETSATCITPTGVSLNNAWKQQQFIISKNSMVGMNPSVITNTGEKIPATVLLRDDKKDLILLSIKEKQKASISLSNIPGDTLSPERVGALLMSPLPGSAPVWGVIGTPVFDLPSKYSAGYIGAATTLQDGKLVLNLIQENSAAKEAGLEMGDEIISINNIPVQDPDSYINTIRMNRPNDLISVVRRQKGITDTLTARLRSYPITSHHPAESFDGGKSVIRDGFQHVFVQDGIITAAACGGPVFDVNGRFMGINIARYSRTSTIVVTPVEINEFLKVFFASKPGQ